MDRLTLELVSIPETSPQQIGEIEFAGICFIDVIINGRSILSSGPFDGSFAVLNEMEKSAKKSGKYLLFTCVCGVADDAGWDLIDVNVTASAVSWKLERENLQIFFAFDRDDYVKTIESIRHDILQSEYKLEPAQIVFPE